MSQIQISLLAKLMPRPPDNLAAQSGVRVLLDGSKIASYRRFCLARTAYAPRRLLQLAVIYAELQRAGECVKKESRPGGRRVTRPSTPTH